MKSISDFVVQVDNFSSDDVKQLVHIHRQEIHLGFLTSLGEGALGLLFSMAAESKNSLLVTLRDVENDKLIGFLLGTLDTGAFYKDFLRRKFFNAVLVLLPKVFSFSTVKKLVEVLFYPARKDIQEFPKTELLDIAILGEYQGQGLAKKLFMKFADQLKNTGIKEFKITTGEKLERAQRFYESLGAVKVASIEVHEGQKTIVYVYKILG